MTPDTEHLKRELEGRRKAYATCKRRGLRSLSSGALDDALFWFHTAGFIGSHYHFGEWADPDIDRAVRRIATALGRAAGPDSAARPAAGRVAHLTSNVLDGGGHTEILLTWSDFIRKWGDTEQHLISSEWTDSTVHGPDNLETYARMLGRPRLCPGSLTPTERVRWLYEQLTEVRPSLVVMHVTPADVFSVCAALMLRDSTGASLAYFNHADHVFGLGTSFADRVIEFRREGARYSVWRRGVEPEKIRFVPLGSRPRPQAALSRGELCVPADATVSLTVAQYYKLVPDGHWDYGKVIRDLLESEPRHYHLVVGHGPESAVAGVMKNFEASPPSVASRLVWLGRRTDVGALLGAADFLIESFPFAGGTLRVDAMRAGAAVVSIRNARWPLITETDAFGADYPLVAATNEDVLRFSRMLIKDAGLRSLYRRQLSERYEAVFSERVLSETLREALLGRAGVAPPPDFGTRPEYDLLYAVALDGRAIDLREVVRFTENQIKYAHTPDYGERLTQLRDVAKESLKYRLRRLLSNSSAP
jgi:glycosyltransferase involved in cell wall biosynthesis